MTLQDILIIIEHYRYLIIFPVMVIEGPIVTVICGFLVYLGFLNSFAVYILLVIGDLVGDTFYYSIGKYGIHSGWLDKLTSFFGYNKKSEEFLKNHFEKHAVKTLLIAKASHGLGIPVQITAGIAKVNYLKYILVELIGTMPKTLILLALGYYLGNSYLEIDSYLYLSALTGIFAAFFILLFIMTNKYAKNLLEK